MTDEVIEQLLLSLRNSIAEKTPFEEATVKLKSILSGNNEAVSALFDVLTALNSELGESTQNSQTYKLLSALTDEILPAEVLSLELNALGAEEKQTKSKIVKSKTRIYYKQIKFNLLREESEGYAKLITEILSVQPGTSSDEVLLTIERLIGQFNLDPNRVLDIILDCFENNLSQKDLFTKTLKKFKVHRDELRDILLLKFVFCEKSEYTSMDLYRVASILCQEDLVDLRLLFNMISPIQNQTVEENKRLIELVKKRASKAEIISTGSLADSSLNTASSAMLANNEGPERMEAVVVSAVSFGAASQSQVLEDAKLSGSSFEDSDILTKNQKLGLLCALLEHGAWAMAKQLLDRLPEGYPTGVSQRISAAIANIIGYSIEPFYKQKYSNWKIEPVRGRDSWKRFTNPVEQMIKWEDFTSLVYPLITYIGPYICVRHEVAIKLIRLILAFLEDEAAKELPSFDSLKNVIMDMFDGALVPGCSLLDSNFAYCEELWQVLQRFSYQDRYRIYGRWKNVHTARCWALNVQRSKVLGMTKYAMKRLSKDTAKVVGRQLGKLCHTYPLVALEYMLDKVQDFQNFIGPVVDSMRFLSNLEFDVLSYCLIENLAEPAKQAFKTTDVSFSPWMSSLANFSAAVCKRYSIEFLGILQYIANQLKDGKNLDLIVLREIVLNISGVESGTDLTQEHLEALCGGECLRQEAGYYSLTKINRRATSRLRDALMKNDLFESLCILLGQQKNFIIYIDSKEYPLKLTAHMVDQSQETFIQFFQFLRSNLKPEEYAKRMPSVSALLTKYHVPTDSAMCLTRSIYFSRINALYDESKKSFKEDGKTKLDAKQKFLLYNNAFNEVVNALEEELIRALPDSFWMDITSKLYATFWLLSVNDLSAPFGAYEREIEKCKKEAAELTHHSFADSSSKARRSAKDEERLKNLEQKLTEEMHRQSGHAKRIKDILSEEKEKLFAATQNKTSQMLRFLQSCILPRSMFSEVDAVYCAKFVETLHCIRTGFFQTIVFFDKIFSDVTPILAGLTEREANCFGRFCCMSLNLILKWHSSKAVFVNECEGFPGCVTRIRKQDSEDASNVEFTYDYFRSICYKWQVRLAKSLAAVLSSSNYVLIRNGLTLMTKILPNFPVLQQTYKSIEKNVTTVRDNEKGKRLDLNLLASSYLVQLVKRNVRIYRNDEFFDLKIAKLPPANESAKTSPEKAATAVTRKRTGQNVEEKTVEKSVLPTDNHTLPAKKKVRDH